MTQTGQSEYSRLWISVIGSDVDMWPKMGKREPFLWFLPKLLKKRLSFYWHVCLWGRQSLELALKAQWTQSEIVACDAAGPLALSHAYNWLLTSGFSPVLLFWFMLVWVGFLMLITERILMTAMGSVHLAWRTPGLLPAGGLSILVGPPGSSCYLSCSDCPQRGRYLKRHLCDSGHCSSASLPQHGGDSQQILGPCKDRSRILGWVVWSGVYRAALHCYMSSTEEISVNQCVRLVTMLVFQISRKQVWWHL